MKPNMKKFFLSICTLLLPLAAFAQLNGSGYYRVQNYNTKRYISIVGDYASIGANTADLESIKMLEGSTNDDFEDNVAWNPATLCYFESAGGNKWNLKGGGMDLYGKTGYYLNIDRLSKQTTDKEKKYGAIGTYTLYGKVSSTGMTATRYISDFSKWDINYDYGFPAIDFERRYWNIVPVTQEAGQYLGIKPEMQADGYYWTTMYAHFPWKPGEGMKAYWVSKVENGYAILKELTEVPESTPVLVRCTSDVVANNKVSLLTSTSVNSPGSTNYLKGVYFCNPTADKYRKVTPYNKTTMRMLAVSDGKLVFTNSDVNISYIPANKAYVDMESYLKQHTHTYPTLTVITEEDYVAGISTIEMEPQVKQKGVYNLNGQRIADSTEGLSRGVYIVNGRMVVLK